MDYQPPEANVNSPELLNRIPEVNAGGMEQLSHLLRNIAAIMEVLYATTEVAVKWVGGDALFLFTMIE